MRDEKGRATPREEGGGLECERLEPLLTSYLLEELTADEGQAVSIHLEGCAACREELSLLRATSAALSAAGDANARGGASGDERVLEAGSRRTVLESARRGREKRIAPLVKVLTSLAALFLLGTVLGTGLYLAHHRWLERQELAARQLLAARQPPGTPLAALSAAPRQPEAAPLAAPSTAARPLESVAEPRSEVRASSEFRNAPLDQLALVERLQRSNPPAPPEGGRGGAHQLRLADPSPAGLEKPRIGTYAYIPGASGAAGEPAQRGEVGAALKLDGAKVEGLSDRRVGLAETDYGRAASGLQAAPGGARGRESLETKLGEERDRYLVRGGMPRQALRAGWALGVVEESEASKQTDPAAWGERVDQFLARLKRLPGETPGMMFFRYWGQNPYLDASTHPLSTFSVDVDTASYTLFRSYLSQAGVLPPREAIRTEEFINYFPSGYPAPAAEGAEKGSEETGARPFAIHAELAPSPFSQESGRQLLKIGLKAREVAPARRKACGLVFVVDTSGSMRMQNRLELVKDGLRLLVKELDEGDQLGIVAFDQDARVVLEPAPASKKELILSAIAELEPRHNTNVAAGLKSGYQMAAAHLIPGGQNRVVLLSDGVANTGIVDPDAMLAAIRDERQRGIYLTCVGVGMGNHNDALLERLADQGDGQCVYLDRIEEARKIFVERLTGTLETVARKTKVQVEFDPAQVLTYRLLGYENRAIADGAFRDNSVEAGAVGSGQEVVALYELAAKPAAQGRLATVHLRYLTPEHGEAQEMARVVLAGEARSVFADAPPRFQLTACVAALAEVLRESYWARPTTLEQVAAVLEPLLPRLGDPDAAELLALVKRADKLVREREAGLDQASRTAEALKETYYQAAQIEDRLNGSNDPARRAELEEIRRQNDELKRRLEALLSRP
jgi:Ca-activated chloride channel family protein